MLGNCLEAWLRRPGQVPMPWNKPEQIELALAFISSRHVVVGKSSTRMMRPAQVAGTTRQAGQGARRPAPRSSVRSRAFELAQRRPVAWQRCNAPRHAMAGELCKNQRADCRATMRDCGKRRWRARPAPSPKPPWRRSRVSMPPYRPEDDITHEYAHPFRAYVAITPFDDTLAWPDLSRLLSG